MEVSERVLVCNAAAGDWGGVLQEQCLYREVVLLELPVVQFYNIVLSMRCIVGTVSLNIG